MLVLDHSGSMTAVMSQMQTDAIDFVNMFASGRDNLGLVTFGGGEYTAYTPKTTFLTDSPNVPTIIGQIAAYGATNTASAVWAAYQQLVTLNEPGAVNVIVLFTDGQANTFTGNFTSLVSSSAGCSNLGNPLNGAITVDTSNRPYGLLDFTYSSLNDKPETRGAPNSNGCANITLNSSNLSSYLTGMPSSNVDGNSTNGTGSIAAYLPVTLSSIDPTDLTNAALNTLDDASNRIRGNTTLKPVVN
jgi:hypothetical protein